MKKLFGYPLVGVGYIAKAVTAVVGYPVMGIGIVIAAVGATVAEAGKATISGGNIALGATKRWAALPVKPVEQPVATQAAEATPPPLTPEVLPPLAPAPAMG